MQGGAFKLIARMHRSVIMLQNCNNQQWNHCGTEKKAEKRADLKRINCSTAPWCIIMLQNCKNQQWNHCGTEKKQKKEQT